MKRKLKSLIAVIAVVVLALSMNTFVFAADDIVLDGDGGASSFIGEYSASGSEYKYLGFVTTKEATSEYTKLQLTYKGDISCLRIEFNRQEDDSNEGPYWFEPEQALHFIVSEGTLDLNPSSYNTVTFDLAAMGIDIGEFWGMHLHYLDPNMQDGSFSIKDARFIADAGTNAEDNTNNSGTDTQSDGTGSQSAGTDTQSGGTGSQSVGTDTQSDGTGSDKTGTGTQSGGTGSQSGSDVNGSDSDGSGTNSGNTVDSEDGTTAANSISVSGGTDGTAGGSTTAAPSTGSVMWPIAIALGGIVVAVVAFIGSKKLKEE